MLADSLWLDQAEGRRVTFELEGTSQTKAEPVKRTTMSSWKSLAEEGIVRRGRESWIRWSFGENLLCDSVDVPGSSSDSWGASRRRREGRDSGQVNDGRRPHRPQEVRTVSTRRWPKIARKHVREVD